MLSWWQSKGKDGSERESAPYTGNPVDDSNCETPFLDQEEEASSSEHKISHSNNGAVDPELAISPKSIRMLQEAEARAYQRSRLTSGLVSLLLLGVFGFLLYPRGTIFSIDSFEINAKNSTFTDGDRLMTNWNALIGIANRNFFPINLKEIKITAYLDHDRRAPIGNGHGQDLRFSARSRSSGLVTFQMPVYAPSTGLPSLIGECMTHERVDLFLRAEMDLSWTHWSGHWIPMEFYASIDCKVPAVTTMRQ